MTAADHVIETLAASEAQLREEVRVLTDLLADACWENARLRLVVQQQIEARKGEYKLREQLDALKEAHARYIRGQVGA